MIKVSTKMLLMVYVVMDKDKHWIILMKIQIIIPTILMVPKRITSVRTYIILINTCDSINDSNNNSNNKNNYNNN